MYGCTKMVARYGCFIIGSVDSGVDASRASMVISRRANKPGYLLDNVPKLIVQSIYWGQVGRSAWPQLQPWPWGVGHRAGCGLCSRHHHRENQFRVSVIQRLDCSRNGKR